MFKFSLLINLLISFSCFCTNWNNNDFDVISGLSTQALFSDDQMYSTHSASLLLSATQLKEGWGYKFDHFSKFSEANDENNIYSNSSTVKGRAFFTDSASIEVSGSIAETLQSDGAFASRNSVIKTVNYFQDTNVFSGQVDVAKDNQFWNVYLKVTSTEQDSRYIDGISFVQSEKLFFDSQFEWQITEDSFITSRLEASESNFGSYNNDIDVFGTYLGFKTRYLGSSELSVFLGESTSSESRGILSWQMSNRLTLNEYSNLIASSKKVLLETEDERFSVGETVTHSLEADIQYSDVWSLKGSIIQLSQKLSEEVSSKRFLMSSKININMFEHWQVVVSYTYDDYLDDRYEYNQEIVKLEINRDLL